MEKNKFPLLFWQETEEFKDLYKQASEQLLALNQKWTAIGGSRTSSSSMQCNDNGIFELWINDNTNWSARKYLTAETAVLYAIKHGDTGWWELQDLEDLLNGKGKIFERAMRENGFRKHKKHPETWVKKGKDDERPSWYEAPSFEFIDPFKDEGRRLLRLITIPNVTPDYGSTLSFIVGSNGMIHGHLNVNPMGGTTTESMSAWYSGYRVRGHISKQQNGFSIEAKNILIGKEKYIYVTIHGDTPTKECIWPTTVRKELVKNIAQFIATGEEFVLV